MASRRKGGPRIGLSDGIELYCEAHEPYKLADGKLVKEVPEGAKEVIDLNQFGRYRYLLQDEMQRKLKDKGKPEMTTLIPELEAAKRLENIRQNYSNRNRAVPDSEPTKPVTVEERDGKFFAVETVTAKVNGKEVTIAEGTDATVFPKAEIPRLEGTPSVSVTTTKESPNSILARFNMLVSKAKA